MRIALGLEYDGSAFCGWQSQPSGCGVQDHVQKAVGRPAVVNVTNLAIVTKRSNYHTLVWVTDAITGANLSGAEVAEYKGSPKPINELTTDRKGIALFKESAQDAKLQARS